MGEEEKQPKRPSTVDFKIDESAESTKKRPSVKRGMSKRKSLRASFLRLKSLSFRRSGGERGADIDTLRGTHGPEFEGYAKINRSGGAGISCGCFGGSGDTKEKIILIKGAYCFVFVNESDPAPKYAIACAHMKAKIHSPSHGVHPVTIETALGDVEWDLTFQQKQIAKQFADAFKKQAAVGESDEVRKRLGHDKLLNKRGSVRYAEAIAEKKLEEQPEKKENVLLEDVNRIEPMMAGC
ncbi:unnamed protein product [Pseudo-nitzschia multistriata]|uniref:Uncharacterized protein n=1 Tax=Pseudo-nitzschia multistriata TaxID=183589 RepID=A0A448Z675_9STRA|nr:unnamed protein product [Pseudo-nitzschia multistriata]